MNDTDKKVTLKERRERAGKTIREIAAALGVTERTYIRWEQDESRPGYDDSMRLADYWRVHPKNLFPQSEPAGARG